MDTSGSIAHQLLAHTLGGTVRGDLSRTPVGMILLRTGRFPDGWVKKYLDLIRQAEGEYRDISEWPRELAAAVYVASVYCDKRYRDWRNLDGSKDAKTERELEEIRWAGDSLVIGWFY